MNTNYEPEESFENRDAELEAMRLHGMEIFMNLPKDMRFESIRTGLSLKVINKLYDWALEKEDYEICGSIEEVRADIKATYSLIFFYEGNDDNSATVIKYLDGTGKPFYHADCLLHNGLYHTIVKLYRDEKQQWRCDTYLSIPVLSEAVGKAIDQWEKWVEMPPGGTKDLAS